MLALDKLDWAHETDLFEVSPHTAIRPDIEPPASRAMSSAVGSRRLPPSPDQPNVADIVLLRAETDRDRAEERARDMPTSTTLAALARAHAHLNEEQPAVDAAQRALTLSLVADRRTLSGLADVAAARVAVEVLRRFQAAEVASDALAATSRERELPVGLVLARVELAAELGQFDHAFDLLSGRHGPMINSYLGFVLLAKSESQRAITYLRRALQEAPDDAAAAMNLATALWNVGSRKKALASAARAVHIAPGRKDFTAQYLHLLLEAGNVAKANDEMHRLRAKGTVPDAQLDVLDARCLLHGESPARALPLLSQALSKAAIEENEELSVEISANLQYLKFALGRQSIDRTKALLGDLLRDHPHHEVAVTNFARVANTPRDGQILRRAAQRIKVTLPARAAFLEYRISYLQGDNEAAGAAALQWFENDRGDANAAFAAMVCLGIGLERWAEAATIAEYALAQFPGEPIIINNAAYALAMNGQPAVALRLLTSCPVDSPSRGHSMPRFVLKATLGLAHLASGDIDTGMRCYRRAAEEVGRSDSASLSLMTIFQALVVNQLGLDGADTVDRVRALALPPHPVPSEIETNGDVLRLRTLCTKRGLAWPPTI